MWDAETGSPISEPLNYGGGDVLSAYFSPDGKKVITAWFGGGVTVWEIGPLQGAIPVWLPKFVEALSGQIFSKAGALEVSDADRAKIMGELRKELTAAPDNDEWTVLGRWFLGDLKTRTISPFSKITVPQCIEACVRESTEVSLDDAERMAQDNEKYMRLISLARSGRQQRTNALDLVSQGRLAEAEAPFREWLKELRVVLASDDPALADGLANLADNLISQNKYSDAENPARECLAIREKHLPGNWRMFNAKAILGMSLLGQRKYDEAEPLLLAAYRGLNNPTTFTPTDIHPPLKETFQSLIQLYEASGQPQKAIELRAQKMAEIEAVQLDEAECFRQAAESGETEALNSLAWLLATSPSEKVRDGGRAVAFAEKAVAETNHKNDAYIDTLAAAYAEAGRFEQAIAVEKEAIALTKDAEWKGQFMTRLKLYESGGAYHEDIGTD